MNKEKGGSKRFFGLAPDLGVRVSTGDAEEVGEDSADASRQESPCRKKCLKTIGQPVGQGHFRGKYA